MLQKVRKQGTVASYSEMTQLASQFTNLDPTFGKYVNAGMGQK